MFTLAFTKLFNHLICKSVGLGGGTDDETHFKSDHGGTH